MGYLVVQQIQGCQNARLKNKYMSDLVLFVIISSQHHESVP